MRTLRVRDLGRLPYEEALAIQHQTVDEVRAGSTPDTLLMVEHPAVFTLGRKRTALANVLNPGDTPVVQVERGGDVTWHGPGQVVIYPIVQLVDGERDILGVLRVLERAVVATLARYGLASRPDEVNTGVWTGQQKIASVGIAVRDWVTFHGLALNVDPDLSWFARINPCGLNSNVMTSMSQQGVQVDDLEALKLALATELAQCFGRQLS